LKYFLDADKHMPDMGQLVTPQYLRFMMYKSTVLKEADVAISTFSRSAELKRADVAISTFSRSVSIERQP